MSLSPGCYLKFASGSRFSFLEKSDHFDFKWLYLCNEKSYRKVTHHFGKPWQVGFREKKDFENRRFGLGVAIIFAKRGIAKKYVAISI